jgi:arylsulfatase A-like enzyme
VWLSFESEYVVGSGESLDQTSPRFVGTFAEPVIHDRARYREGRAVVLVSIDTLRRDHVSVYGYRRKTTPSLANLAEDSVVFHDAVSTSSWTLPAHASLLTSLNPSFHGAVDLHQGLSASLPGLPRLLQEHGFFTQAMVTHLYLSEQYGFGTGFDRHAFMPETRAQQVTDRAVGFLTSKGDEDFFLFLHYYDPHWHYDPPAPYNRTFDPTYEGTATGVWWDFKDKTRESIDPRDLHHIVALYDGEIRYTDRHLERLFREMKRLGVYDKAMIIVTSDHGEEFLDHGGWEHQKTLYEEQIRVPLIVKLPHSRHKGQRVLQQVSLIDIPPTVLDYLGLPKQDSFQGESVLSLLDGAEPRMTTAWSETEHTLDGSHKIAFRRGYSGDKAIFSLFGEDRSQDGLELFGLSEDPGESSNLAAEGGVSLEEKWLELEQYLSLLAEWRLHSKPSAPVELTPEQLDKLRALGYVHQP